jgi:alpha-tubulin suppressor-like RCC1 family protein
VLAVAGGTDVAYALRTDGTVWAWGRGRHGALGNGHAQDSGLPVRVVGLNHVTAIAASGIGAAFALRDDGTVWSWGDNTDGLLGNGNSWTVSGRSVPAKITGLAGVTAIAAGYDDGYAVIGGRVWAWGNKAYGALGAGDTGNNNNGRPIQVTGLTSVVSIAAGRFAATASTSSGNVWVWGNGAGIPTNPNVLFEPSWVPIHWKLLSNVKAVAEAGNDRFAILRDGTVRSWGSAFFGVLGNGHSANTQIVRPVRVSGLTHVKALAAFGLTGYALRTDGTVWSWGWGHAGALGSGGTADRSVPGRVVGLTGITAIGAGSNTGYAVKAS